LVTSIHGVPLPELKTFINSPTSFWTSEDVGYSVLEYPLHDFLLKIALANSDHIFTCSYTTFDDLRSLYKTSKLSNISVIHNGICFDEIDNIGSNSDAQDEQEERYIVFAGRLYWIKGIIHLLEAFKIVARNFPDLSLKIFGRGPLEGEIRKMALDAGLEEKILIKGYIPRKKLIEEVKGADLVVLPSLIEANPMFALEAMACRRPVIAFNYPFMREIIVNMHNGILAKPASIADISEKISLVLSDENLRSELGKNAYEYVRKNHDWDILIEKYIKVYTEIIDD
jgi:glycosyltransferase involved in cell wall biosynthesis